MEIIPYLLRLANAGRWRYDPQAAMMPEPLSSSLRCVRYNIVSDCLFLYSLSEYSVIDRLETIYYCTDGKALFQKVFAV
jgi:hypothetical protein